MQKRFFTKFFPLMLLLVMLLGACSSAKTAEPGCLLLNGKNIAVDAVMTIDGHDISADMYRYQFLTLKAEAQTEDETWDEEIESAFKERVAEYLALMVAVEEMAGQYGIARGEDSAAYAAEQLEEVRSEYKNEKAFRTALAERYMTETQFRLSLLIGNTFNRKMTDYDLMNQAADWKEVLTQARKEKLLVLEEGKRVRDYVAAVLGEKPTKIAQLEAINNNATEEVKEQFEKGNMKITSAYETSRLSEDAQKEVAAAVEAGADIKSEEIKQMSEEKKKKRKTAEDIAKEQNVSDTDTSEEEKANAKKLHAVKMLEKYYIYLSEEETGILERMLEDCKRRKREYALEED